jgi:hypothetical protein
MVKISLDPIGTHNNLKRRGNPARKPGRNGLAELPRNGPRPQIFRIAPLLRPERFAIAP